MEKRDEILANVRDVRRRRFNPQSAPALDQQFGRVAFIASVNTELDKGFSCCADAPEDLLYDAVLVALRIDLEAVTQQPLRLGVARFGKFLGPVAEQVDLSAGRRLICIEISPLNHLLVGVIHVTFHKCGG
jgi:hypothetical protein